MEVGLLLFNRRRRNETSLVTTLHVAPIILFNNGKHKKKTPKMCNWDELVSSPSCDLKMCTLLTIDPF